VIIEEKNVRTDIEPEEERPEAWKPNRTRKETPELGNSFS